MLQEVFIKVHKSLSTFQPSKGAFTTWLHRITVNHCLNRQRKRHLSVLSFDEISNVPLCDHTASPESRSVEEVTQQALGQLSEKLRTVVILRYYWELSYAEMAQILDIPVGTVKSRLNLALRTLHKKLETAAECDPASKAFYSKGVVK